jgi:hypothetical protein
MAKRLLVIDPDNQGQFFLSVEAGTMMIGGDPNNAEVVLRDLHIARIRCEIEVEEDLVVVGAPANADSAADNQSTGGQQLHPGEAIHVGHSHLRLEVADTGPAMDSSETLTDDIPGFASEAPTDELRLVEVAHPPPAAAATVAPPAAEPEQSLLKQLHAIDGGDQGRFFPLPESGTVTLGKSQKYADIVLNDLYVSRVHCELAIDGDQVVVTHVEGQNGTLINGQRITQPQELRVGEVLRLGNSHLRLEVAMVEDGPSKDREDEAETLALADEAEAEAAEEEAFEVVEEDDNDQDEAEEVEEVEEAEGAPVAGAGASYCLPHAPTDQLLALEDQAFGHFQIGRLLGRGQSGLVFRAQDVKNNRVVALKVLSPDFPKNDVELQNFVRALRVTPNLHHAHLVTVYGAGKIGSYCWISREYVDGESVARLITRLNNGEPFDWTRACRVAIHLGKVLSFLHHHRVVHGNLTPRNVLVAKATQTTKLADLMVHQALDGSRLQRAIVEKKLLAELPYLAPEQTEPKAVVNQLSDIYSLGAVLYALLTGQPPFNGNSTAEVLAQMRDGKIVKPTKFDPDVPVHFEAAVLKMLARRPEKRYQSAAEMLEVLEPIASMNDIEG